MASPNTQAKKKKLHDRDEENDKTRAKRKTLVRSVGIEGDGDEDR